MRTRARVSSTTSSGSIFWRSCGRTLTARAALLEREGQDHRVEADHAVLFAADVEVVPLDFFGVLFEGDDRAQRRHVAERVGAFVEAVAAAHHLAVADRRALRAVHADVGRGFGKESNQEIDAVNLEFDGSHGVSLP